MTESAQDSDGKDTPWSSRKDLAREFQSILEEMLVPDPS